MNTTQPCLTKKQVAQRLNVHVKTVDRMIKSRKLVGFKVGDTWRMKPENLEGWIEKQKA